MVARAHPNGLYDYTEEADGSRTLIDVPILIDVEIPLLTAAGDPMVNEQGEQVYFPITPDWMQQAILAAQADYKERRYRMPVKVNHDGGDRAVEPAGLFLPTRIREGVYKGKPHSFLLADVNINRPKVWEELQAGQMVFLSPELRSVLDRPEVNAVSLMRDVEPFQRLPPLIPRGQIHAALMARMSRYPVQIRRLSCPPAPAGVDGAAFLQSYSRGVALLMDLKATQKKPEDEKGAALCQAGHPIGGEQKEEEFELDEKGKAFLAGFGKLYAQHHGQAKAPPADVGGDSVITTGTDTEIQPTEQADPDKKKPPAVSAMAAQNGPAMARLEGQVRAAQQTADAATRRAAKLEGEIAGEKAILHKERTLDQFAQLLAPYGCSRAELVRQWELNGGEAGLKAYTEGVQAKGTPTIGSWSGDFPANVIGQEDPELKFLEELPAEARPAAAKLAASHRAQAAQGRAPGLPLRPYVVDSLILTRTIGREFEPLRWSPDNYQAPPAN